MEHHSVPSRDAQITQYAIDYLVELVINDADKGSDWWGLIAEELLQSSMTTLKHAMKTVSEKMASHEQCVLMGNTHLRFMTKAMNNADLMSAVAILLDSFVNHVLPASSLSFDFVDPTHDRLELTPFESILFFLFCYQDEVITGILHYFSSAK